MGICHEYGAGVWRNEPKAIEWYRKAAVQGHAHGQFNLALCLESGFGTRKDETLALEMYRKAAEQGHLNAQFHLQCKHRLALTPSAAPDSIDFAKLNYQGPSAATFAFGTYNIDTAVLPADFVKRFRSV